MSIVTKVPQRIKMKILTTVCKYSSFKYIINNFDTCLFLTFLNSIKNIFGGNGFSKILNLRFPTLKNPGPTTGLFHTNQTTFNGILNGCILQLLSLHSPELPYIKVSHFFKSKIQFNNQ